MTIYPGAQYRPLAAKQGQTALKPTIVILHTMVGNLSGTDRMFRQGGWSGTESHFGVGGPWGDDKDGIVYQWQDTDFRADANLEGNHRIISIETADNAPARADDIKPWTPKQVDAIVRLVTYLCRTYNIPAVLIPDSGPGRRGIGYHRLGIDPWRVSGGVKWSTSRGKECPGDARIAQIPEIVVRVRAKLITTEAVDMLDDADVDRIAKAVWALQRKLTPADADALGGADKTGQLAAMNTLTRFPPAVERVRREGAEQHSAVMEELSKLTTAVENLESRIPPP